METSKNDPFSIIGAETPQKIDAGMRDHSGEITITGLKQASFEYFIEKYGSEFHSISLFKCPLIPDLSPLEELTQLKSISIYWNQRATRLWDLSKNPILTSIGVDDFTRLKNLNDLPTTNSLKSIGFGDKIWDSLVIESLSPLREVNTLEDLKFSAKKVEDKSLSAIAEIPNLSKLWFPMNLYTTEQVAWLSARIADKVDSEILSPFVKITHPYEHKGKMIDTYIVGKRKPSIDSTIDKKRFDKYVSNFEKMVEHYRSNLSETEPI